MLCCPPEVTKGLRQPSPVFRKAATAGPVSVVRCNRWKSVVRPGSASGRYTTFGTAARCTPAGTTVTPTPAGGQRRQLRRPALTRGVHVLPALPAARVGVAPADGRA